MADIVYEIDDTPAEVVDDVINDVNRGELMILRRGDLEKAQRAFQRARQRNIEVISAVKIEYNLNKQEIKETIGHDIKQTNDVLKDLATKMSLAQMEAEKKGQPEVSTETLADIKEVETELESFHDVLVGLEESRARIRREGE